MNTILIGLAGFFIIHLCDLAAIKNIPAVKPISWILGSGLLIRSLFMISLLPVRFSLPIWATWLGWIMLIGSTFLLVYSLFINLPFHKTYIATGVGEKLINTGLYALVRHPGAPCFILLMLSLILVARSTLMLIAAPIFVLADIALVIIQDKFLFGQMFPDYERYRHETPMLVPNRKSLRAFIYSLRQPSASEQIAGG